MKIEITTEQFNKIQDEIIKLETRISDNLDQFNTWNRLAAKEEIEILKRILDDGYIDTNLI